MVALLLCLLAFAGQPILAHAAQTVEQAIGDVDAAYQAAPDVNDEHMDTPKKLFHPSKAKSTKKGSRDFVEVHKPARSNSKLVHKAPAKKSQATVQAGDLMDGMRQSLDPKTDVNADILVPAPADNEAKPTTANAAPAADVPAGQQIIKPLPSGKLFHPNAKASSKDVNDVLTDALPEVTPKPPAAPTSIIDQPFKETRIDAPKKEEPKKDTAKTGAPLLSDLSEAPSGAENVKADVAAPAPDKKTASETPAPPPAPVAEPTKEAEAAEGYSKPRTLFSSSSDKRKRPGVSRVVSDASIFSPNTVLPPVAEPAAREPMIQPVATPETVKAESSTKKSIWGAPTPDMSKGKVLFTQTADGTTSVPEKAATTAATVHENDDANSVPEPTSLLAPVPMPSVKSTVYASCGAINGISFASKPSSSLCTQGTASAVSGNGPWHWTCSGANGGNSVDCSASVQVNGECGPANGSVSSSPPPGQLCVSGMASDVTGAGPWRWSCSGSNGGVTAECVANAFVRAVCGTAHGLSVTAAPADNLCSQGAPTTVIGSGPFMWSCQGPNGDSVVNCMAPLQVNGVCGVADGVAANTPPSSNLCRAGRASSVTGAGPYVWTCAGAGGGISPTCQAPLLNTAAAAVPKALVPEIDNITPDATMVPTTGCTPLVKRWTITCSQGGYPSNYFGVIVGETQTLCPTNVERGVWLSNSCKPAENSAPVSPSPGKLVTPQPLKSAKNKLTDMLPDIAPLSASKLDAPNKLFTPHYKRGSAPSKASQEVLDDVTTLLFAPTSEALDSGAINALEGISSEIRGDEKALVTLNAYAAVPADGDQQESRRLSLARALAVRSYLMRKGVPSNRIDVRALGPATDTHGDDRVDIRIK